MPIRKLSAAAAVLSLCSLAAPVGGALADTTPTGSAPAAAAPPLLTFVPPKVGSLGVNLGATIINGKVISPGVHVVMPGTSLPPMSYTPPAVTPGP